MVYTVSLLDPAAGMKFFVDPEIKKAEILKKVIQKFGCNVSSVVETGVAYDGAILLDKYIDGLKLNSFAKTVFPPCKAHKFV